MWNLQTQLKWSVRAQWTLATALVLTMGGFYALAYRPNSQQLVNLRQQITRSQNELSASQTQTSILPRVQREVGDLRDKLARFKTLRPQQEGVGPFIGDIAQLGQQASLKQWDWKPGDPVRNERCNEQPVRITFEGDFVNVYSFLRHAEDLQRLSRVRSMNLKTKDKQGQVKANLTMNIYFAAGQ
jgi:Tfp pilus assembly protein PilO